MDIVSRAAELFSDTNTLVALLGLLAALLGAFGTLILRLQPRLAGQRTKGVVHVVWSVLWSLSIVILAIAVFTLGVRNMYYDFSTETQPNFGKMLVQFLLVFACAFVLVHFFVGYCCAGVLNRWPFKGRLWPKGIDYLYYFFGALLLIRILANYSGENGIERSFLWWQVSAGVWLFNLKLFKASYDLFPDTFRWKDGWVRLPTGERLF